MIRMIVFDLWKTLCYRSSIVGRLIDDLDLPEGYETYSPLFERAIQRRRWPDEKMMFSALAKAFALPADHKTISYLQKIFEDAYDGFLVFDHVLGMLEDLRTKGYVLGLISNSSCYAIELLRKKTDLLDLFDYPVFSYQTGFIKPEPEIYRYLLDQASIAPEESLMIGDKKEEDVKAPQKCGMNGLQYISYPQLKRDLKQFGIDL